MIEVPEPNDSVLNYENFLCIPLLLIPIHEKEDKFYAANYKRPIREISNL